MAERSLQAASYRLYLAMTWEGQVIRRAGRTEQNEAAKGKGKVELLSPAAQLRTAYFTCCTAAITATRKS